MPNYRDTGMSDLEQEFELEMEGDEKESAEAEENESDWEMNDESEAESGDPEFNEEAGDQELFQSSESGDYAERFYELSQREFESESELDNEVRQIVNGMEQEFFWNGWKKKLKGIGSRLVKRGLGHLAQRVPGFKGLQAVTQLARGDLKGALGSLAKSGLASLVPGGAVALPALQALGFEAGEDSSRNREAWENYVEVAREAFNHLGRNLNEHVANPLEANRAASNAFQSAVRTVQARVGSRGGSVPKRTMTIKVRRGERIIIKGI